MEEKASKKTASSMGLIGAGFAIQILFALIPVASAISVVTLLLCFDLFNRELMDHHHSPLFDPLEFTKGVALRYELTAVVIVGCIAICLAALTADLAADVIRWAKSL